MFISFSLFSTDYNLENSDVWSKKVIGDISVYTKKDSGKVPVLCFHKIGTKARYEITSDGFESFLSYLNSNNFYVISDKDFINRDFSKVPTGFKPIVLGSDDASEGNFIYKTTTEDIVNGEIDNTLGEPQIDSKSMVGLLNRYLPLEQGKRNFTFYVSFNGIPFRQTGGREATGEYYRGIPIIERKFNYLLDNFEIGIHTTTHPVTKDSSVADFKWEIDEFYRILESYVGDRVSLINTIAYPYGCADLKPEMEDMLSNYSYKNTKIIGGFDFNGYFSGSPFTAKLNYYDISRLGVDNQNIKAVYGFLESVPLFHSQRVIVVNSLEDLKGFKYNDSDRVIVGDYEG